MNSLVEDPEKAERLLDIHSMPRKYANQRSFFNFLGIGLNKNVRLNRGLDNYSTSFHLSKMCLSEGNMFHIFQILNI